METGEPQTGRTSLTRSTRCNPGWNQYGLKGQLSLTTRGIRMEDPDAIILDQREDFRPIVSGG